MPPGLLAAISPREDSRAAAELGALLAPQLGEPEADRVVGALRPHGEALLVAAASLARRASRGGDGWERETLPRHLLLLAGLTPAQRRCVQHLVPADAAHPADTHGRRLRGSVTPCWHLIDTFVRHPGVDGRVCLALLAPGSGAQAAAKRVQDLAQVPAASWRDLAALRRRLRRLGLASQLVAAVAGEEDVLWAPLLRAERALGNGRWATLGRLLAAATAVTVARAAPPPTLAWLSTCAAAALRLGERPLARAVAAVCAAKDADACLLRADHVAVALSRWAPLSRATGVALARRLGARPAPALIAAWAEISPPTRERLWRTFPAASPQQVRFLAGLPPAQLEAAGERCRQAFAAVAPKLYDDGPDARDAEHVGHIAAMCPDAWRRGRDRAAAFFAGRHCSRGTFLAAVVVLAPPTTRAPTGDETRLLHALPGGDIAAQLAAWQRLPAADGEAALIAVSGLLEPWKDVRTYVGAGSELTDDDDDFEDQDHEPPINAETLLNFLADHRGGTAPDGTAPTPTTPA